MCVSVPPLHHTSYRPDARHCAVLQLRHLAIKILAFRVAENCACRFASQLLRVSVPRRVQVCTSTSLFAPARRCLHQHIACLHQHVAVCTSTSLFAPAHRLLAPARRCLHQHVACCPQSDPPNGHYLYAHNSQPSDQRCTVYHQLKFPTFAARNGCNFMPDLRFSQRCC